MGYKYIVIEFISKFPIVAAPMNKVSDAGLAISVYNAGCIPSLSIFNHRHNGTINYKELALEIDKFSTSTGSNQIILSVAIPQLKESALQDLLSTKLVTHLEIIVEELRLNGIEFTDDDKQIVRGIIPILEYYKSLGIGLIIKCLTRFVVIELEKYFPGLFDYYMIKGEDAAGSVVSRKDKKSLLDEIVIIRNQYPNVRIIAAGGISCGEEIRKYLNAGAELVALGTAFAMCKESVIADHSKEKILQNKKIERFENSGQNAVMFGKYNDKDDYNHTGSLVSGIKGNDTGHVFIGKGIQNIDKILTVDEMIKDITKGFF
jgi:NAD(P)H-dependent flavin oxidoreductase YrpB (nitropropane dioxygenase family)